MSRIKIHLDRLSASLEKAGATLKRAQILEIAAQAFGFHNSNEATAAARHGELDPPVAAPIGTIECDGHTLVTLRDPETKTPFAVETAGDQIAISPYSGLVRIPRLDFAKKPVIDLSTPPSPQWLANQPTLAQLAPNAARTPQSIHCAVVRHEFEVDHFIALTAEHLDAQLATYARALWTPATWQSSYGGRDTTPDHALLSDEEVLSIFFDLSGHDVTRYDYPFATIEPKADRHPTAMKAELQNYDVSTKASEILVTVPPGKYGFVITRNETRQYLIQSRPGRAYARLAAHCEDECARRKDPLLANLDVSEMQSRDIVDLYFANNSRETYAPINLPTEPPAVLFNDPRFKIAIHRSSRAEEDRFLLTFLTNGCCEEAHADYARFDQLGIPYKHENRETLDLLNDIATQDSHYPLTDLESQFIAEDLVQSAEGFAGSMAYSMFFNDRKFLCIEFELETHSNAAAFIKRVTSRLASAGVTHHVHIVYDDGPDEDTTSIFLLLPFSLAIAQGDFDAWKRHLETSVLA